MRSTGFVVISLLVHAACVWALIFVPTRMESTDASPIEVTMSPPAPQAGAEEAPPAPVEEKPVPQVKAKVHRHTAKPQATQAPAEEPIAKADPQPEDEPAAETETAPVEDAKSEDSHEEFVPVKETPPVGVEAAESTDVPEAALPKGGASKEGAISYLDLKQAPGNKPPTYPINARLQNRQGQVELLYRVTKEGKVADVQVAKSSGSKDLDDAAVSAVSQYRYVPGQEGWARHPVNFALKGPIAALPSKLRAKGAQND